jgi:hypothetical protein
MHHPYKKAYSDVINCRIMLPCMMDFSDSAGFDSVKIYEISRAAYYRWDRVRSKLTRKPPPAVFLFIELADMFLLGERNK